MLIENNFKRFSLGRNFLESVWNERSLSFHLEAVSYLYILNVTCKSIHVNNLFNLMFVTKA